MEPVAESFPAWKYIGSPTGSVKQSALMCTRPYRKCDLKDTTQEETAKKKKKTSGARIFICSQRIVGHAGLVNWCFRSLQYNHVQHRWGKKKRVSNEDPCSHLTIDPSSFSRQHRGWAGCTHATHGRRRLTASLASARSKGFRVFLSINPPYTLLTMS